MQERHHVGSLSSVSLHLSPSTPHAQLTIMKQQPRDEDKITELIIRSVTLSSFLIRWCVLVCVKLCTYICMDVL